MKKLTRTALAFFLACYPALQNVVVAFVFNVFHALEAIPGITINDQTFIPLQWQSKSRWTRLPHLGFDIPNMSVIQNLFPHQIFLITFRYLQIGISRFLTPVLFL